MSILIMGMAMPKKAGKYRIEIEFDSCGNPYLLSDNGDLRLLHIIPVPDHGRLVDMDELRKKLLSAPEARFTPEELAWVLDCEEAAPTIIPADEGKYRLQKPKE